MRSHVTNSLLNSVFFTAAVTVMHFLMALLPSACTCRRLLDIKSHQKTVRRLCIV